VNAKQQMKPLDLISLEGDSPRKLALQLMIDLASNRINGFADATGKQPFSNENLPDIESTNPLGLTLRQTLSFHPEQQVLSIEVKAVAPTAKADTLASPIFWVIPQQNNLPG